MTRRKAPASFVRSSAAEHLTFVAASGSGGVEAVYADENVWLSQKMMAQLYGVEGAVLRSSRMTAADGKGYDTKHHNLSAIIAARPGLVARIKNAASLTLCAVELGFYRARFAV